MSLPEGKNWLDIAREVFPDATDERLDFLLWNKTKFPFAGHDMVLRQLQDYKDDPTAVDERVGKQLESLWLEPWR